MSPSRFQMAFRQVYGTTAYEYLKVMRMNYALLQDSDDNIRTIAFKVGYRNAGHFSKLFRETFGMGPKEYRTRSNENSVTIQFLSVTIFLIFLLCVGKNIGYSLLFSYF